MRWGTQEHVQLSHTRSPAWSHFPLLPHGLPAKDAPRQTRRPVRRTPSASAWGPQTPPSLPAPTSAPGHRFDADTSRSQVPGLLCLRPPEAPSTSPSSLRAPLCPPPVRNPSRGARHTVPFLPPLATLFPPGAHQAPPPQFGSSEPRPPPKSFPAPPLLPGGYSLKPLRISLARSSLADMMRRLPPAALPRWLGGASQTVPRNRGRSRSPAGHLRQAAVAARPEPASPSPKLPLLIPSPSL